MHNEIEQFIQSVRRHNPSAKTWRSYSSDLRLFASLTREVSFSQVKIALRIGTNPVVYPDTVCTQRLSGK